MIVCLLVGSYASCIIFFMTMFFYKKIVPKDRKLYIQEYRNSYILIRFLFWMGFAIMLFTCLVLIAVLRFKPEISKNEGGFDRETCLIINIISMCLSLTVIVLMSIKLCKLKTLKRTFKLTDMQINEYIRQNREGGVI